ncbi:MAG: hypothetical protein JSW07_13450 [bacterium]|nr:MAG: hypothetical protein JSW07_13450 [bacterium]
MIQKNILYLVIGLLFITASVRAQDTVRVAERVTITAEAYKYLKGRDANLKSLEESVFKIQLPPLIIEHRADGTTVFQDSTEIDIDGKKVKKPLMARVELGYLFDDEVPLKINYQIKGSMKKSWWERIDFPVGIVSGIIATGMLVKLVK